MKPIDKIGLLSGGALLAFGVVHLSQGENVGALIDLPFAAFLITVSWIKS